ncbi:hypothetical protein AB0O68_28545 [Streptomyces sp. NPDC087512]|uniref:hypothetical protein n=1 Tax=Streptomyces sp. NPDC087512 TaxID=3155059 RepID=UPI00341EB5D2
MSTGQQVRHGSRRTAVLGRSGLLVAALATMTAFITVTSEPAVPAAAVSPGPATGAVARGSECAEAREKVERLEGLITPNACAFVKRQIAFGETPTGTPPEPGELSHPRVRSYLDIFDEEATLWEAGSVPQRGHTTIGNSITGSLRLVPDLRYTGTEVVADGAVVMFGQWNEVTVKGRKVAYPQIARNVLSDDGKSVQARRYYDRYTVFGSAAPELRNLFEGVADAGRARGGAPQRFRADEITARLAAWNDEDVSALAGRMGGARLTAPGLSRPLVTTAGKIAYLQRLFDHADLELKAGQVAFGETTAYVEWHGRVTSEKGADVPFGIVERFGPGAEWELSFDTLPLIADDAEIAALFQKLTQP